MPKIASLLKKEGKQKRKKELNYSTMVVKLREAIQWLLEMFVH